ncbi:hypothetical protein BT3_146 [Staphylococcus phage BT3]|nr:hypothetical protein BT3_146 [Staphylococcus phage BT3]WPH66816.1 ssDNA binding protein [Staphylococcus phage CUB-A]
MKIHIDSLDFTNFTIKDRNGNSQEFDITDELKITEYTIQEDFMQQSAKYAFWASILEKVRAYSEMEQRNLETIGSKLNLTIRQEYEQQGKKPTKDMIESSVYIHDSYQQQLKVVEAWNYKVKQLQYVVKAFETRRDMMIQLGAELRQTNKNGGITNPFSH